MHISKPHLDEATLVVNVVNPTAGLLEGDEVTCEVAVEAGAQLLLTAPSASRAHRMRQGQAALVQEFRVAAGGMLDVWPELLIPQAGTRYQQRTTARVEPGGTLLLTEMLAPGRVAFGEVFAYEWLSFATDFFAGAEMVARERYTLRPSEPSVEALRRLFHQAYYASVYVISDSLTDHDACWAAIHDLHQPAAWVGTSRLRRGGWVIKMVAADSINLRRTIGLLRRLLYAALARPEPNLRRVVGLET